VRGFHIAAISDLRLPVLGVLCSDEGVAWEGKGVADGRGVRRLAHRSFWDWFPSGLLFQSSAPEEVETPSFCLCEEVRFC